MEGACGRAREGMNVASFIPALRHPLGWAAPEGFSPLTAPGVRQRKGGGGRRRVHHNGSRESGGPEGPGAVCRGLVKWHGRPQVQSKVAAPEGGGRTQHTPTRY